jgi:hypothetical protein
MPADNAFVAGSVVRRLLLDDRATELLFKPDSD